MPQPDLNMPYASWSSRTSVLGFPPSSTRFKSILRTQVRICVPPRPVHIATMLILTVLRVAFSFAVLAATTPSYNARPFAASLEKRRSQNVDSSLQVDLGYDVYQGVANHSTGLNTWKGYAVRLFLKELHLTFTVFDMRPLLLGLYVGKLHNRRR
jgi:hypothetical protein